MTPRLSIIKRVTLGWFGCCYLLSLMLIPIFPFVTVGFSLPIALMIILLGPLLFLLQGLLIGAIVWLGLTLVHALARAFNRQATLARWLGD